MIDQARLTEASRAVYRRGLRILQGYRLAPDDHDHIAKLLDYMDPAPDTRWLDVGCGFGEPARIMREIRPDLKFWLVSNNTYQLDQVPLSLPTFFADMYELPFPEATFDGAMFLYSLCHADNKSMALREAARVVRPGGSLFVFDYLRVGGDDDLTLHHLGSSFIPVDQLMGIVDWLGDWKLMERWFPEGDDAVFRAVFTDQELYDEIFRDLVPVIWKAVRT